MSSQSSGKILNVPGVDAGSASGSSPGGATSTGGAATGGTAGGGAQEKKPVPCLEEVKTFVQNVVVAEKNLQLYPPFSKIVRLSAEKLHDSLEAFNEASSTPLQLWVSQKDFLYEDAVVYHEEHTGKSLAYRLYTDGIRSITFNEETTAEELNDFVLCFRELRNCGDDENDFGTVFWEKDSTHIQLQIVDDTDITADDEIPDVPKSGLLSMGFQLERLDISHEEEERLKAELSERLQTDEGDATFELSAEEAERIDELAKKEEEYFPVYDFVDVLIELMVKNGDPEAFNESAKMIRAIAFALVENLDFHHAAGLLRKLSTEAHPGLTADHKRQIREMIGSFCDRQTLEILSSYLKEHAHLSPDHGIFLFLRVFDRNAVKSFCQFLEHRAHHEAMTNVLLEIGRDSGRVFAQLLDSPSPEIAQGVLRIVAQIEDEKRPQRIASALKHPDEKVRHYAAKLILELDDEDAASHLLALLDEDQKQLLHFGLQFFAQAECPEAYSRLLALSESKRFFTLDKSRQTLCFKALLKSDSNRALEYLTTKLLKGVLTFGAKARRRKAAALLALSASSDDRSIKTLQRFAAKERSALSSTAKHALRLMVTEADTDCATTEKEAAHV